ncbi:hypothetical protein [Paraburkholderia terrae]|uniref:hypothetical protein n=1 Tax=Paraburkholderia terrae TaxID=311230 RepID=UPI000AA362C0|nr:hypothetical protein [Paraburkholderia terrae]
MNTPSLIVVTCTALAASTFAQADVIYIAKDKDATYSLTNEIRSDCASGGYAFIDTKKGVHWDACWTMTGTNMILTTYPVQQRIVVPALNFKKQ